MKTTAHDVRHRSARSSWYCEQRGAVHRFWNQAMRTNKRLLLDRRRRSKEDRESGTAFISGSENTRGLGESGLMTVELEQTTLQSCIAQAKELSSLLDKFK